MTSQNPATFEPLHKGHSIEQCAIGLAFEGALTDDALKAVRDSIGQPAELPGRAELRGVAIPIGQAGPGVIRTGGIQGFGYTRSRPDGLTDAELQITRNVIAFRTMTYTRWAQLLNECLPYFNAALPHYLATGRLTQVSINYVDKFISSEPPEKCRPADILKKGSPYVAPGVFDAEDLWHSHAGFFKRLDESTKQLTTINVDYLVETLPVGKDRTTISISTVLAHMYNQPTYTPFSVAPQDGPALVKERLEKLHALDKDVLSSIISADMARRIALQS
jgi:uncharacterized protein (TIGR04255 family)